MPHNIFGFLWETKPSRLSIHASGIKYCITETYSTCMLSNSYLGFSGSKKPDGQRYQKIHRDDACQLGESWVIMWWAPGLQLSEPQHLCLSVKHKLSYVYCRLQDTKRHIWEIFNIISLPWGIWGEIAAAESERSCGSKKAAYGQRAPVEWEWAGDRGL